MNNVWTSLESLLEYSLVRNLAINFGVTHKRLANIFHPTNLLSYLGVGALFTVALLLLTEFVGSPAVPFSMIDGESWVNSEHVLLGWFFAISLYLGIWSKRRDKKYTVLEETVVGNQDVWVYILFTLLTGISAWTWELVGNEPARLVFVAGWLLQVVFGLTGKLFHEQCEILVGPILTNLTMILVSTITLSGLSTGLASLF